MKAREALREADAAFQQTALPAEVLARMRRRTLAERRSGAWLLLVPVAAALLAFVLWPRVEVEDVQLAPAQGYAHGRFSITAQSPTLLHRDHDQLTVKSGDLEVSVAKHAEPVRIAVSHGAIEVVGTRFTIHQGESSGSVTLHEGVIRFIAADATTTTLAPGETLEWPPAPRAARAEPEPEAAPVEPQPQPKAQPKPQPKVTRREPTVIHETDAAWLLEEVDTARSRGEYAEAVRLLDKGLAGIVSAATRERFSFELGSMLTWQLTDPRACGHWRAHQAAFPNGRYAREVERAIVRAKCAQP